MASKRYVIYLRVSTPKQGENGLGVEAQREAVRRYLLSAVMLVLSVVVVIFYFRADAETRKAKEAESRVAAEKERADGELKKAQTTQSQFLAALARRERAEGDAATAILLALEALPDDTAGIALPYIPEPEAQLDGARRDLRERFVLNEHEAGVTSAALSPDGKRIVTASADGTARLWEIFASTQELVSHAKAVAPRCLTAAQRHSFGLSPEPPWWCIELAKWPYDTTVWKQWLSDSRAGKNPPLPTGE